MSIEDLKRDGEEDLRCFVSKRKNVLYRFYLMKIVTQKIH